MSTETWEKRLAGDGEIQIPKAFAPYYTELNPMQKQVLAAWKPGCGRNLIVSAPTGSGKSLLGELTIHHHVTNFKPGIYVNPLKALASEKNEDWATMFAEYKRLILTGDYQLTDKQQEVIGQSDILIMTFEMLYSRTTKAKAGEEKSDYLREAGCLVVDEGHTIGDESRGHVLEVMLMSFCDINPKAEIVLLSATISDLEALQRWLTKLTGRETTVVHSEWRSTELKVNWHQYSNYDGNNNIPARYDVIKKILNRNPDEKVIIFCPTRADTKVISSMLEKEKFRVRFHNASLDQETRREVEGGFRQGDVDIIVSTTTLAMGLNMPAKRVIIAGVHRGTNELGAMEVWQCAGRAGRPRFGNIGYADIIVPKGELTYHQERLAEIKLESVLGDVEHQGHHRNLEFHLMNQIYRGIVSSITEARAWFERSLAFEQYAPLIDLNGTIANLLKMGIIEERRPGVYGVSKLGKIACSMYFYPDDVSTWARNFDRVVEEYLWGDKVAIAKALIHPTQMQQGMWVSAQERNDLDDWARENNVVMGQRGGINDIIWKYTMLNHKCFTNDGSDFRVRQIRADLERWWGAVKWAMAIRGHGDHQEEVKKTMAMMIYGIPDEGVKLIGLVGIGRARAMKMIDAGIKDFKDVVENEEKVKELLGPVTGERVVIQARRRVKDVVVGAVLDGL